MSNFSSDCDGLEGNNGTCRTEGVPSITQYPEYQAAVIIWKTVPPCILLLGGFGNIATVFVMRRIKDHNSSQHVILTALAVADLILLSTAAPDYWLWHVVNVDVRISHSSVCKLYTFTIYVSSVTSAWLVTCVTVQRTMAVLWPHRMRGMCTVRRTWIVIAVLFFSACAVYSHLLIGMEITDENDCRARAGLYDHFLYLVFSWIDLCLSSFFPGVCLLVCDVVLSVTLFKSVSPPSVAGASVHSSASTLHSADSRRKVSYRTTVMVLAISCAFLVLTLPVCVYIVWVNYNDTLYAGHPQAEALVYLLDAVARQMWLGNSAINFFLYCLTGAKFRREFVSCVRCGAL